MPVTMVSVAEAAELLARAALYVDVRSVVEFQAGHVPGAYNVPWMHADGDQLRPNPEFVRVMLAAFAREQSLIIGCHSGTRSRKASAALENLGFTELHELSVGFEGRPDAFGRIDPGWRRQGKAVELEPQPGHDYQALRQLPALWGAQPGSGRS